jgi:poly(3-hydroxybutyrate) depolymerase
MIEQWRAAIVEPVIIEKASQGKKNIEREFPGSMQLGDRQVNQQRAPIGRMAALLLLGLGLPLSPALGQAARSDQAEAAELIVPGVSGRFADLFQKRQFRYTGGVYHDQAFAYRLFVPVTEPGKRYPIVVWLHGHGEAGRDNDTHLAWLGQLMMPPPWQQDRFPFFVLCTRCPIENDIWNGHPAGTTPDQRIGSDMISVTDSILSDVVKEFPIDRDRIYLSGVSSGGSGSWEYALRYPERFAAVAPLGAAGIVNGDLKAIDDLPVWVFHSTHDHLASVDDARRNVTKLRAAGGRVRLTEIDSASHDCWTAAFAEHELLDWMLAQHRGGPVVMDIRPWSRRVSDTLGDWSAGQVIGQVVVLGLLGVGLWRVLMWVGRQP